jgi:hypothetical protein
MGKSCAGQLDRFIVIDRYFSIHIDDDGLIEPNGPYFVGSPVFQANLRGDRLATAFSIYLPVKISLICLANTMASGDSIMSVFSLDPLITRTSRSRLLQRGI